MPWDDTELRVASIHADGTLGESRLVAGGQDESIFQARLVAGRDALLRLRSQQLVEPLRRARRQSRCPCSRWNAEFGAPQWVFGTVTYGFLADGRIVARYTQDGAWRLAVIEPQVRQAATISTCRIQAFRIWRSAASGRSPSSARPPCRNRSWKSIRRRATATVLRASSPIAADPAYTSIPQAIEFPTTRREAGRPVDGPRVLLSADQPRLPRPGRRKAAAIGDDPRRARRRRPARRCGSRFSIGRRAGSPCAT